MSFSEPSRLSPVNPGQPPENLDDLLRAFFRAEMPTTWPTFAPPVVPRVPSVGVRERRRSFHFGRRMALAASILLLLATATFVSRRNPEQVESTAATPTRTWSETATRLHGGSATPATPAPAPARGSSNDRSERPESK